MDCAICYNTFFVPKSEQEFEEKRKELHKNIEDIEDKDTKIDIIKKFRNLLITPQHNTTHTCSTDNCNCIICGDC